jgi:hypothetical protein
MIIYQHWYDTNIYISIYDLLFILLIIFGIVIHTKMRTSKKIKEFTYYKYYSNALIIKVLSSIVFALVVMFFYPGDSFEYFKSINALNKLLLQDSSKYFDVLINGNKPEYWSYFNNETGFPAYYMWRDPNAIFVARVYSPIMLLTNNSYLSSSIVAGLIGFSGIWKLYSLFCTLYPNLEKKFAIAILYFPSVLFWSSGIMKDTLTISAVGWIVYCFYKFAILRKFKIKYILAIFISSFVIINIKAYIFVALLPGILIWLFFNQIKSIKSGLVKFLLAPVLIVVLGLGFVLLSGSLSSSLGAYGNVDSSIKQAQVIQQDLTRSEQYGDNFYDIGKFDASPTGLLSKAPIAIVSGLFRPFLWEARNPFVILAALEATFLMFLLLYCLVKLSPVKFFSNIFSDPMLIFALSFTLLFAFGIGLATANFGALVRYKIPMLPFFLSGLFILLDKIRKSNRLYN